MIMNHFNGLTRFKSPVSMFCVLKGSSSWLRFLGRAGSDSVPSDCRWSLVICHLWHLLTASIVSQFGRIELILCGFSFIWTLGGFYLAGRFLLAVPHVSSWPSSQLALWVFSTNLPKRPCSRLELLSACLRYFLVSVYSQFGADVFVNVGEFLCEACVELFFENHTGVLVSQLIYVFCNIHQTLLLFWLLPLIPRFKALNLVCCVLGEFFSPRLGGALS